MRARKQKPQIDPKFTRVFERIDMHDGDAKVCWDWQGYMLNGVVPLTVIDMKRYSVHRVVYALTHGMQYPDVPFLTWTCDNHKCCNPNHLIAWKGSKIHKE